MKCYEQDSANVPAGYVSGCETPYLGYIIAYAPGEVLCSHADHVHLRKQPYSWECIPEHLHVDHEAITDCVLGAVVRICSAMRFTNNVTVARLELGKYNVEEVGHNTAKNAMSRCALST